MPNNQTPSTLSQKNSVSNNDSVQNNDFVPNKNIIAKHAGLAESRSIESSIDLFTETKTDNLFTDLDGGGGQNEHETDQEKYNFIGGSRNLTEEDRRELHAKLDLLTSDTSLAKHYHILQTHRVPNLYSKTEIKEEGGIAWVSSKLEEYRVPAQKKFRWDDTNSLFGEDHKVWGFIEELGITVMYEKSNECIKICYDYKSNMELVEQYIKEIKVLAEKKKVARIGFIQNRHGSVGVTFQDFKKYEKDLILLMDEDVIAFRDKMLKSLKNEDEAGLFLLHGEPGTGKTSFIKSIIGDLDKDIIYLTPAYAEALTSPDLLSLLMDHQGAILVIEDAESVIMKRAADNSNAVSNLLNLTDGFPADYMKLKIICTFNTDLENIDEALLREGRLKAMKEFKPLKADVVQRIAKEMGREIDGDSPLSLAKICNQASDFNKKDVAIGF